MEGIHGKLALVTGASSGIGRATALELARRGARLLLTGRDPARCDEALAAVRAAGGADARMFQADFSRLAAVRELAADIRAHTQRLDVLINNAGSVWARRKLNADGHELTFAINHLAPFLLTGLLLPLLHPGARIVNVSSEGHRWGAIDFDDLQSERRFKPLRAYGQTKTANILWSMELARRLEGSGVTSNSLHPGAIRTNLGHGQGFGYDLLQRLIFGLLFIRSAQQGAATPIYLATSQDVEGVSGRYYVNCREKQPVAHAADPQVARRLWEISEELVGFRYDFSGLRASP